MPACLVNPNGNARGGTPPARKETFNQRTLWKNEHDALNGWKAILEALGILVFQILDVSVQEMRGFSIPEIPYPTIALNRSDSPLGRIFTLVHELCHIMLKQGGICTSTTEDEPHFKIERFCNAVAGALLVPKNELIHADIITNHGFNPSWSDRELIALKKKFWASQEVILRRLLEMNKTTKEFYRLKREAVQNLPLKSEGGPERVYERVLRTHSRSFINILLTAMREGQITLVDVSYYLDMSLKHLPGLEQKFAGG